MSSQRIAGSIAATVHATYLPSARVPVLGAVAIVLGFWVASANATAPAGCASFSSQAAAQGRFTDLNGSPSHDAAGLDADGDGVACEDLAGPYKGFATIGYNLKKGFFYGTASMPEEQEGDGFACLMGNRHFPEGPRRLRIFKVGRGADRAVSRAVGAEAKSGHLVWKLSKSLVRPGRYYAAFEEQLRLSPYKPSECPGFRSDETLLPRPRG